MTSPRITLAVLAYNQSCFIDDAVRSALAQRCEPIEILLSDDASPDSTFQQMQALAQEYAGPHQVVVRRNETNLGIGGHFNALMEAARGELVVLMAGDDLSLPNRVALTAQAWDASQGRLDLIACDVIDMDRDGQDHGVIVTDDLAACDSAKSWALHRPYIVGAGHALTRRQFRHFGPLRAGVNLEDQVNTLRAVLLGGAITLRTPLVRYRRGGVSTRQQALTAQAYVELIKRQSARQVALYGQWLADAAKAGRANTIEGVFRREHHRERFIRSLLESPDFLGRLKATRQARSVALGWRVRKLIYWQWPAMAAFIRRLQHVIKKIRHGQAWSRG